MRRIFFYAFISFLGISFGLAVFAHGVPDRSDGFVNDYAQILNRETRAALEQEVSDFEQRTTNEISVALIARLPEGETIEEFANHVFRKWGIGKKDKNNGVLLLVSVQDRTMRIEVGYGLEGDLTDIETQAIQQEIIRPYFKEGDYDQGLKKGVEVIERELAGESVVFDGSNIYQRAQEGFWSYILDFAYLIGIGLVAVFFFVFLIIGLLAKHVKRLSKEERKIEQEKWRKRWWLFVILWAVTGGFFVWLMGNFFPLFPLGGVFLTYYGILTGAKGPSGRGSSGSSGGGWSSGGGFGSSSGGGFGGGSSGGGGSSSRW